ncbi:MAG TPA: vWA domain-containing protein [Polyangiaceae bacterium]|nr:vWA domain-containing protein [Polyangiaceae bacterium]
MKRISEVSVVTRTGLFGLGLLGLLSFAGCSSKQDDSTPHLGPVAVAGAGGEGGGGDCILGCGTGGTGTNGGANGAGGIPENQICGGTAIKAEALPVDMYIMFDQSSSMSDPLPDNSGTWWGAAQSAVTNFVNNQDATGMTVGIQYFPLQGVAPQSCNAPYDTPEVELGPLPANAGAIAASIAAHSPSGFTPTSAALQGAINHMKAWAPAHPGHAPVVVFVTDGFPTECDPTDIQDIAAIAQAGFDTEPKVRTFVVGFNLGQAGENLKQIAKAGGTDAPFLIDGGDIGTVFVNAMLSITDKPLQCSFDTPKPPPGQTLDVNLVDVRFQPSIPGSQQEQIPKLNNQGDCELNQGQGWYYDSPAAPKQIIVCPDTCSRFAAGVLDIVEGCKPLPGKTK